jgi:hypothetical protein
VFVTAMLFPVQCHAATPAGIGEPFKNITAGIASIFTALAVSAGGVWAYYKFIKGRTFRPRISGEILGQWRPKDDAEAHRSRLAFKSQRPTAYLCHVRIRVTNIGAAKVTLKQYGTGLEVSFPTERQPVLPHVVRWDNALALQTNSNNDGMFKVFGEQEWIEPGETVSEDLLLDLGRSPTIAQLELHLTWSAARWERLARVHSWVCRRPNDGYHRKDVADFVQRIIPPDSTMIDNA